MNFHKSFKQCSILTPDTKKQPQISLQSIIKGKLRCSKCSPLEGGMYINLWTNFQGHPENVIFLQFSQNMDGFRQNDSHGF